VQEILKGKLDRRGFQAVLTSDIVRAAALCRLKPAECIVIDLDTTGREGVDQYAAMKRTGAVKSAVFLVSDNQGSWLKGLEVDSIVQLGKPLLLGPVYQSVRGLVERYRQIPGGAT
jgi:DNA-binding response OmpR family regulator